MNRVILIAVVLTTLLAITSALSLGYVGQPSIVYPGAHIYSAHSSSLLTPSQQQYHVQDEFGQYAYGYNEPLSAKEEVRSVDGITRGSYNYLDAEGKIQTVAYTADANGFHVAATNLPRAPLASETPVPVTNTVEVAAARSAHLAAHKEAELRLAASESATISDGSESLSAATSSTGSLELPQPVQDTPDVALAKAEHLKRHEQERLRNAIIGSNSAVVRSIIPGIYNYGYPLNMPLLSSGYYY